MHRSGALCLLAIAFLIHAGGRHRVLKRPYKRTAGMTHTIKGNFQRSPDFAKPQLTERASGSPVSGDSAQTGYISQPLGYTSSSPELESNRRLNEATLRRKKGESMKAGGPCYVCWATGELSQPSPSELACISSSQQSILTLL